MRTTKPTYVYTHSTLPRVFSATMVIYNLNLLPGLELGLKLNCVQTHHMFLMSFENCYCSMCTNSRSLHTPHMHPLWHQNQDSHHNQCSRFEIHTAVRQQCNISMYDDINKDAACHRSTRLHNINVLNESMNIS